VKKIRGPGKAGVNIAGHFGKSLSTFAAVAFLSACASTPPQKSASPAPAPMSAAKPVAVPEARSAVRPVAIANPLTDPSNILAKRSVFYDLDEYDIAPAFTPVVEAHARYLRDHPAASIVIQGNCDERGSPEYNIALGQRRSQEVLSTMKLLGVPERQMEAVSLGEEKPKAPGHDEASWAENRRSDIVYRPAG
jgi:peptidoglycan-associated lipoprotein